jgi:hypothetical protein
MTHYPLLFGFRDLVAGRGFLAGVAVNGRALLVHDDDNGYWLHGVNPGGLSAGGSDMGTALQAFRETHRTVLFDISADAAHFDDFKVEVERFFHETSERLLSKWTEAVERLRAGEVDVEGMGMLQIRSDRARLSIEVVPLSVERLEPTINEPDEEPALANAEPELPQAA